MGVRSMQLQSFRIFDYRSINDSSDIEVDKITALLGRNESGKTNLLLALRTLNPVEGFQALNPTKDFPRHRRLDECTPDTKVVTSAWTLSESEGEELKAIYPRAANVRQVTVERPYKKHRSVEFGELPPIEFDEASVRASITAIADTVKSAAENLEGEQQTAINNAIETIVAVPVDDRAAWASAAQSHLAGLTKTLDKLKIDVGAEQKSKLESLRRLAQTIAEDKPGRQKAEEWVLSKLPVFIFLDEYPELDGYQNIQQYNHRKDQSQLVEADHNFEKLCKVAGIDARQLHKLHGDSKHEERNQLANRASAVVTAEIRRLWKDRKLKVRFNFDGEHFSTFVSDPTNTFDVEVNLDERSRGFRWFFSFYITFSADTDGGRAANAILLLDEPGLFLHIESQKDLQVHFERDFKNQIIYTTHSPFMIPIQALDRLRTVNISEETGTTVTNNPTGDGRTLAPIRAALGYYYADSLFISTNNLIVEGVTDWWILESVSKYFVSGGKSGLPSGLALPPVDGAPKVPNMVSLLTAQRLNVLVLLDDEPHARGVQSEMLTSKLLRDQQLICVSEAFEGTKPIEADIEDLIDPKIYEDLSREAYAKELTGKVLKFNANIPRIVKRLEAAFKDVELTFNKTRPAGLFYRKMAVNPSAAMTDASAKKFERLFAIIKERLEKWIARGSDPFH